MTKRCYWRGKGVWAAILAGGMAALAGVAAHHLIVDVVDATAFCVSCHSMDIPAEEYRRSTHYRNPSGMRAECPDCHVPRQFVPNLWAKAVATRDLWGELTGSIDTAEKYEARRLDLAQRVWAKMESSDSRECRACHAFDAMDAAAQTDNANLLHSRAAARGDTCISCHKGLAHAMPDMGVIVKAARADLEKTLGVIPEKTAKVYLPTTSAYFLAADGQTEGGRMMAGIGVDYLGRQGDLAHVRLKGWRQEGEDSVLYAEAGKRILAARLNAGARGTPAATGREVTPAATGPRWSERTLEVWLPAAKLTTGDTALWRFASALYSVNCAICHAAPRVNEYDANQWPGRFKAMMDSTPLSEDEQSLVQTWLQRHASDAGAPP